VNLRAAAGGLIVVSAVACSSPPSANQQGVQALAALMPPAGFTNDLPTPSVGPSACHSSASTRCLSTRLPITAALQELLPLLGDKATNDCPGTTNGHVPCTIYGSLGPASAAVAITRDGGGYDVAIELLET
jgi:hypothetical protein